MSRVAVALSGGVDSSVAAMLLADAGAPVVGLAMRLYDRAGDDGAGTRRCCAPRDLRDARHAADRIGIPFYVIDMQSEFREEVVAPFAAAYRAGRTPVPCIACNSGPKFRHLMRRARSLGADRLATGHYARIARDPRTGRFALLRARDPARDQSYFLFEMTQEQLSRTEFPVGDLPKPEVRRLAADRGLPNAAKPDSQDICFVPDGRYQAIVRRESTAPEPGGEIVTTDGRVVGRHDGLSGFTVGQRRGLGALGGRPHYVVALEAASRRVVVGVEAEQYAGGLVAASVNWVSVAPPDRPIRALARIRSAHAGAPATVLACGGDRIEVRFDAPQRAVAPGQAVVLYDDDRVLGGGFIEASIDTPRSAMLQSGAEARA
ncbi:MAG TPA: tRNA 2-thiouridine(34) synthase MnmA [Dongiaceae bacterium]|nr:tRNA 2-thiouridine(34) synthase MnmA [Dongiaceae bacterium]